MERDKQPDQNVPEDRVLTMALLRPARVSPLLSLWIVEGERWNEEVVWFWATYRLIMEEARARWCFLLGFCAPRGTKGSIVGHCFELLLERSPFSHQLTLCLIESVIRPSNHENM